MDPWYKDSCTWTEIVEIWKQNLEGLKSWNFEASLFSCDSSFELVRVTFFFTSALVLGLLELIFLSSLLVQVLGMLEPPVFTYVGSGFDRVRANILHFRGSCFEHIWTSLFIFFGTFSLFPWKQSTEMVFTMEMKTAIWTLAVVMLEHPAIDRTPK